MKLWKLIALSTITALALWASDTPLLCHIKHSNLSTESISTHIACSDNDGIFDASVQLKSDDDTITALSHTWNSIDETLTFQGLSPNTSYTVQTHISSMDRDKEQAIASTFESTVSTKSHETRSLSKSVSPETIASLTVIVSFLLSDTKELIPNTSPPIIGTLTNQVLENNETLNYQLPITQTDGDTATVTVLGLPTGFSYDSATRTIIGQSTVEQTDTVVTVEAEDKDGKVVKSFMISVEELPVLIPSFSLTLQSSETNSEVIEKWDWDIEIKINTPDTGGVDRVASLLVNINNWGYVNIDWTRYDNWDNKDFRDSSSNINPSWRIEIYKSDGSLSKTIGYEVIGY